MNWLKGNWAMLLLIVAGVFLGRSLFPKTIHEGRSIRQIVTQYDTVRTKWVVHDTVLKVTTDTFNLIVSQTIYDTVVVNVRDTSTHLWPIIQYEQRKDTAWLRTFELTSGHGSILRVFAPGPLLGIYADSVATPRMNFGAWPEHHTSTTTKLFWTGVGYSACLAANAVHVR